MSVSVDLGFQQFSTVGSLQELQAPTIASATSISPTTFLTFLTGTTQVATVVPPVTGWCMLMFVFTNGSPGALLTSGNIKSAYTPIQNRPFFMVYDPTSAKWWVMSVT